jgi:hypothetical protein
MPNHHLAAAKPSPAGTRVSRYQRYLELTQQKGPVRGPEKKPGAADPYAILAQAISAMLKG